VAESNPQYVGRSVRGLTNRPLVAGRGTYVSDLALPGMAHAAVLRSPHAHARIRAIDVAAAECLPGVLCVVTGREVQANTRPIPEGWDTSEIGAKGVQWYALAPERVRFVGEAVAAVVAEDKYTAYQALERIQVDYEVRPAVTNARAALEPGSPLVEPTWGDNILLARDFGSGDPDQAFDTAEQVIRGVVRSQRVTGVPIEPRGIVASHDPYTDQLTFWEATQQPHPVRSFVAQTLGIAENSIRVIQPQVGGAFGLKQPTSQEEPLIAYLSRKLGRPVKWIEERTESFQTGGHSREVSCEYEAALGRDGTVAGLRVKIIADVGAPTAYLGWSMAFVTAYCIPTLYQIPHVHVQLFAVVTNKCPWTPYRGFGKDVAAFLMDRVMDHAAKATGRDRASIRLTNLIPPDRFPYSQVSGAILDSGNYPRALRRVLEMIDYEHFPALQAAARQEGRYIGLGIGQELTPEGCAVPGSLMNHGYDGATVRMNPTGGVAVLSGVTSPGTGNETALAQIAADELGCALEDVRVIQGDTDVCPWGLGNYSSRSVIYGGSAVQIAAGEVRDKLLRVAGGMLEAAPADLEIVAGEVRVKGAPTRVVALRDVAAQVYRHTFGPHAEGVEPGLEATRYFRIQNVYHQPERDGRFSTYPTWPYGAAACIVEVDPETGQVKLLRYCLVEDAGRIVNPLLATANLHGGITQGIGSTLYEQLVYDDGGQLQTATLMDYTIPTAVEVPRLELEHQETLSPFTPLGTKGVGESGLGSVPGAIASAVENAFPELDLQLAELPLTPNRVWRAIQQAREGAPA
jgi:aerobic carbon-monoxide dehydrogenase large subunit